MLKQHFHDSDYKYYICVYQYEGRMCQIELPAASLEDAEARMRRIAYGKVVGEIHAAIPISTKPWMKLPSWLKKILKSLQT